MRGGAENVDTPGGVLDHGHHIGLGAVKCGCGLALALSIG
jgi:hypothetical protein